MTDLTELAEAIAKLDTVTEKINEELMEWEKKLQILAPGLVTWISDEGSSYNKFGYYRFSTGWHLAVKVGEELPKPILESARYYRLAMLKRIPVLIPAILENVKAMTGKMYRTLERKDNEEMDKDTIQTETKTD